ncbi:hypothetical protein KY290_009597 [Solanum tuberosum]|uniref:Uncharacterized protein n=1 Tax=Solanum tuberosum TaxID=4113 RepID=A0ABQ7VW05_SOLTU|nr:hypothetical protein KY284_009522 [Solanum tuberosum]KAH0736141.1 hypothetical protein KY285_011848 [Solanum tuberosum]KAH0772460.1 hypothetical protein KY290_009597 [Solanum tuberosum]
MMVLHQKIEETSGNHGPKLQSSKTFFIEAAAKCPTNTSQERHYDLINRNLPNHNSENLVSSTDAWSQKENLLLLSSMNATFHAIVSNMASRSQKKNLLLLSSVISTRPHGLLIGLCHLRITYNAQGQDHSKTCDNLSGYINLNSNDDHNEVGLAVEKLEKQH